MTISSDGNDDRLEHYGGGRARTTTRLKLLLRLAFVVLAVGGLLWLLHRIGWTTIGGYLYQFGWVGVALVFFLGILENLTDAAALRASVQEPVGLGWVNGCNQAGALLNRFVPWEAGEVLKGTLLRREVSTTAAVAGTVVWNYLAQLSKPMAAIAAALLGWLFGPEELRTVAAWTILASAGAFLPYLGFRILIAAGPAGLVIRAFRFLRLIRRHPQSAIDSAHRIDRTVRGFWKEQPGVALRVLAFQLASKLLSWATLYVALALLDPSYGPATVATVWAGLNVFSYLVALMPTRLGTTEMGGYAVFTFLGLEPALGLTVQCVLGVKAIILSGLMALPVVGRPDRRRGTCTRAVVFDYDGTLVDSMKVFADVAARLLVAHRGWNYEQGYDAYLATSGVPFVQQLELLFPGHRGNERLAAQFETNKLVAYQTSGGLDEEAAPVVAGLRERGFAVVVSSNNYRPVVERFLAKQDVGFDLVLGYRDGFGKGEAHFEHVCRTLAIDRRDLLFVGDSLHDGAIARQSGVAFVARLGTNTRESFEAQFGTAPFPMVQRLAELLDLLDNRSPRLAQANALP